MSRPARRAKEKIIYHWVQMALTFRPVVVLGTEAGGASEIVA